MADVTHESATAPAERSDRHDVTEAWSAPAMTGPAGGPVLPPRARPIMSGARARVPRIISVVLSVVAVICALAAISAAARHGVQPVREFIDDTLVPAPANLGYAAFLAVLAAGVAGRKRVTFWILLAFFALQLAGETVLLAFIAAVGPFDDGGQRYPDGWWDWTELITGTVVTAVAIAVLIWSYRAFYARTQRASLRKAIGTFVALAVLFMGLGYTLVSVFPGTLRGPQAKLLYVAEKVLGGAVSLHPVREGKAPGWVTLLLGLAGAVALFAALLTLLRSQQRLAALAPAQEQRVRDLLRDDGERDSLGYFATRRDKAAVFAPDGRAAVTYRVVAGVSLASGDPVGDPDAWAAAIDAWRAEALGYAWVPAVMGASEAGATAYSRAGLRVLQLGDEAILHPASYRLSGPDMRAVRQAVRRLERSGHTARIRRHADIGADELGHIAELAARWRGTETERGFSMALGRLGDPADGRCVLVETLDRQGRTVAMLSLCPWGARGLSLDLMRRDRDAENGTMEFMVSALMTRAQELGVDRVSLNFAVFRSVFEEGARIGAGPVLRIWRRVLLLFSRYWQLESLYRANLKYQPQWVPRFLCFSERRRLPRVGLASAIAEGFLPLLGGGDQIDGDAGGAGEVTDSGAATPEVTAPHRPEQVRVRLAKLDRIRAEGVEPYPVGFGRTDTCAAVADRHRDLPPDTDTGETADVAGRVVLLRDHGGLTFATLRDWSGDLQLMLSAADTGADELARWKRSVDVGDLVGVSGRVVTSRRGELSVAVTSWTLTAKCLRPLPGKHHGLTDPEAKVRARYLDLATSTEARGVLRARSGTLRALRDTLGARDFLEVETPILQRVHGGANARPFTTHINAYDLNLYLRIAPELFLKRLLVGGVERVFELGRTFRNEGVSVKHNPEFTMLEAYQAYGDYTVVRELCRDLILAAADAVSGAPVARHAEADGRITEHDIGGEWPVRTVAGAVSDALGEPVDMDTSEPRLRDLCDKAGVPYHPGWGRGALIQELYERLVEERTTLPTFYTDFPTEVSPLTRQHRDDPRLAERWDLVAFGVELGTGYSELIDPVEQRRRLTEQSLLAAGGDAEAMELDEDFLTALEYAMPPTGGLGLGVDRTVMLLTGRTIRETLPFPLVRPR